MEKVETVGPEFSGYRVEAAGWQSLSSASGTCCLDEQTDMLLLDEGRTPLLTRRDAGCRCIQEGLLRSGRCGND